ncbi:MAG: putative negative regulator of RcsB-dependent stress response [Saprospiraceae bacterium]|jgi:predicted negative regulator of RcsB-dependent stress response
MTDKEIHISEDEDVERAKAWWDNNKMSIIVGVGAGLAMVFGYNYWTAQKSQNAAAASSLYETLVSEDSQGGKLAATDALTSEFGESVYAQLALLRGAKQQVENDQLSEAEQTLRTIMSSDEDLGIAAIAAMRLSGLLIGLDKIDEAKAVLSSPLLANDHYAARVNELNGDVLLKAGSTEDAKLAYEKSIELLTEQGQSVNLVQLKLENI